MKKILFILSVLLISVNGFSQKNDKIWNDLLQNKRAAARKATKRINTKRADLESIILKQLVNNESGIFKPDPSFLPAFIKKKDMEYYLYALWKEDYVFSDYNDTGFKKMVFDNIDFMTKQKYTHPQIINAMHYLKAASAREANDFDTFNENIDKISSVRDWQVCGVFENLNDSGINTVYPPESKAKSLKPFNANSNGYVNWYTPPAGEKEAYRFFVNHGEYGSGINYAQTFIKSPKKQTVYINFGSGKATKLWLNDVLIFEKDKDRKSDMDTYIIKVNLAKGNNRLLVKTTNATYAYYIVRILDKKGNPIKGLTYSSQYKTYKKSTEAEVNPEELPNVYEKYFEDKVAQNPNSIFYKYCLINTYLRNEKEDKALKVITPLVEKYPKSSLLRRLLIQIHLIEEENTKVKELKENIDNDDEDYYYAQILKLTDSQELFRKDVAEMNKDLDKIAKATDMPIMKTTTVLFKALREGNKSKVHNLLDRLIEEAKEMRQAKLITTYAGLYKSLFNEAKKTEMLYKYVIKKYFYPSAYARLAYHYEKQNKNKKALDIYAKLYKKTPHDLSLLRQYINQQLDMHKYKEALPVIDRGLKLFPYSFVLMKKKGQALQQLKRKKEALKWYKKALSHDGANGSLRDKINDLENIEDPLKKYVTEEAYSYIKKNRGKIKKNNFGVNFLLDETNILLYPEGGKKVRNVSIYEVTTEKGIDLLKEYDLGLYGNYNIIKSEIVKPNGSIVPAEKSGSSFVFNGLSVGDVVYVDYERIRNKGGRFYKDYTDDYTIDLLHPSKLTYYRILVPKSIKINTKTIGGKVNFSKKDIGKHILYEWVDKDNKGLPNPEDYMPKVRDVGRSIHMSTLNSWDDIANWYSDLVSSSIEYNKVVNDAFAEIFPDDYKKLDENTRAKKIYDYIGDNINYSYVDFKQSGFIPQKPSKTLISKLGDCKDLSTLFLALGRKADLDVNLVLVSTNDNGQNKMILPSTGFNHCIAKVKLNGKDQYLEMTDKYLPFKSLPSSLLSATALEIPYKKEDKVKKGLIKLKDVAQTKTILKSDVVYTIYPDKKELTITITGQGRINSGLKDLLDEKNEDVLKKSILEYFEKKDDLDLDLISYKVIQNDKAHEKVIFQATLKVKNKIQKLGRASIFKLPLQLEVYTSDVVSLEKREYPIEYRQYENTDQYEENYTIILKNGKSFTDVPENISGKFKEHNFSQTYKKLGAKKLKIHMLANTVPDKNISTAEYPAFKTYVQKYLEAIETLIGFK
jgi:hypothetical protein